MLSLIRDQRTKKSGKQGRCPIPANVLYSCTWAQAICLKCMLKVQGHTFWANHKCPCYNYYVTLPKANSLNANASTTTRFFKYARLKEPIMVMQQVTL